jgi:hypothetical protein
MTAIENAVARFTARFTLNGKRKEVIECFTEGCCFWFASCLFERFSDYDPTIMYDVVTNHFGCKIEGRVYDITGDVTDQYNWEIWYKAYWDDSERGERIFRDCINFDGE